MPRLFRTVFAVALTLLISASNAKADPIYNSTNGHYYELVIVSPGLNWDQANAAASARTFQGLLGHLATETSAEEVDFIAANFDFRVPGEGTWIGGFQPPGSPEPAGGWQWVTGEPFVYTNWGSSEPNNLGDEDVIEHPIASRFWNDNSRFRVRQAYLVEYEDDPAAIPEPATAVLLLTGAVGLGLGHLARRTKSHPREKPGSQNQP